MSQNPANLILRFFLELLALYALAYWGWTQHAGLARFAWALGLPLLASFAWGLLRTPGDQGKGVIPVPGWLRLLIEAAYFIGAVWALFNAGQPTLGLGFAIVAGGHYLLSYDRVLWLLRH